MQKTEEFIRSKLAESIELSESYGGAKPNKVASDNASVFLTYVLSTNYKIDFLSPSFVGGLLVSVSNGDAEQKWEFNNDGSITVTLPRLQQFKVEDVNQFSNYL